jgi:hypothetical protein
VVALCVLAVLLAADLAFLIVTERSARWLWFGEGCLFIVALAVQWRLRRGAGRYLASSTRADAHDPATGTAS